MSLPRCARADPRAGTGRNMQDFLHFSRAGLLTDSRTLGENQRALAGKNTMMSRERLVTAAPEQNDFVMRNGTCRRRVQK